MFWLKKKKISYFLHIYKTGGTSLNDMLFNNFSSKEMMNLYSPNGSIGMLSDVVDLYKNISIPKEIKIVYGHYAYGIHKENPIPYQYLSFVRDSFERSVSMFYNFHRLDESWKNNILTKYKEITGKQFEFSSINEFIEFDGLHNQQCMFFTGVSTFEIAKDQLYYAKMAIDNIDREFKYVGINSNFESSAKEIARILSLKNLNYNYKNLGVNKPKDVLNNEKLREFVYEMSRADQMIFEYVIKKFH